MAQFSSSIMLADLDYIAPSQQCILPMQQSKREAAAASDAAVEGILGGGSGEVMIHSRSSNNSNNNSGKNIAPPELLEKVQITLQDCLACSGCVTSAETILITNQSRGEVERLSALAKSSRRRARGNSNNIAEQGKEEQPSSPLIMPFLVTVSDQTAAAAAVEWHCDFQQALGRISAFCRRVWGATHVVPLAWAQAVSCAETANEFVERMDNAVKHQQQQQQQGPKQQQQLPLIISACPGWVCYCEKTHPTLLPLMCPIMSAQAIAGKAFKTGLVESGAVSEFAQKQEDDDDMEMEMAVEDKKSEPLSAAAHQQQTAPYIPSTVHVSIQPCFDKKLEAVRPEFRKKGGDDDGGELYTDCVLSTKELIDWMLEDGASSVVAPLDATSACVSPPIFPHDQQRPQQSQDDDGTTSAASTTIAAPFLGAAVSGGYHLAAMAALARQRGIEDFELTQVQYAERRGNKNFRIATHPKLTKEVPSSSSDQQQQQQPAQLLQFALVYGFQHIQNVVRAFSASSSSVSSGPVAVASSGRRIARKAQQQSAAAVALNPSEDFVLIEAMACPSGCHNGGGQMMEILEPEAHQVRLSDIERVYARGFWTQHQSSSPASSSSLSIASAQKMLSTRVDVKTGFTNRRAEFDKLMNEGGVVSLKW